MARTPRTLSGRGHPEAKAGENIGQGESRQDVSEKEFENKPASKRSPRSYRLGARVGWCDCLDCCAVCATPAFFALDANGSFPASTEDATKLISIIQLNNPHTRTTGFQGTRIRMAEPPGTKSGLQLRLLYGEKRHCSHRLAFFCSCLPARACARARFRSADRSMFSVAMWTGTSRPASRPRYLLNSSREAYMNLPSRVTGMPDRAHRCATATG